MRQVVDTAPGVPVASLPTAPFASQSLSLGLRNLLNSVEPYRRLEV